MNKLTGPFISLLFHGTAMAKNSELSSSHFTLQEDWQLAKL